MHNYETQMSIDCIFQSVYIGLVFSDSLYADRFACNFHRVIIEDYCIKIISYRKNTCKITHFNLRQLKYALLLTAVIAHLIYSQVCIFIYFRKCRCTRSRSWWFEHWIIHMKHTHKYILILFLYIISLKLTISGTYRSILIL